MWNRVSVKQIRTFNKHRALGEKTTKVENEYTPRAKDELSSELRTAHEYKTQSGGVAFVVIGYYVTWLLRRTLETRK